jgi:tRNA A-37 threonylcarbamoyl transferase component Bud32
MIVGTTISHYRVVALLGAGGMGEVYKAEDTRLKRTVALKFLSLALLEEHAAKQRLIVEAQAVSTLDHPNICTIHEIDETPDGRVFLAMAFYEGETLKQRIERGTLSVAEAVDIAVQIARGVTAAHATGIIHRDIKPANIFLSTRTGVRARSAGETATVSFADDAARVKLLDFGIAKLSGQTGLTQTGTTVGTVAYMAPEHLAGHAIDERADVWSIGVVLYEMLAGRLPFPGPHELAILKSIAEDEPKPLREARPDVPPRLAEIVHKALQKDPARRYGSAREMLQDLEALRGGAPSTASPGQTAPVLLPEPRSRSRAWVLGGVALLILATLGGWITTRAMRAREAQQIADEIRRLVESEQNAAAMRRLHTIPPALAGDAVFARLGAEFFAPLTVRTDPPGADVYIKGYGETDLDWVLLGRSPIETRGTLDAFRWRVTKEGYETFEGSSPIPGAIGEISFALHPDGTTPEGMISIPGGPAALAGGASIPPFFIDRYEVTNRAFKRFVDAGGYRSREYWLEPFVKDGRTMAWNDAVAEFRDATGRPGPATWELGTYPEGQEEWPVGGVSWHEALAYARFAGKSLPTVHHWRLAASFGIHSHILEWSNFSGKGPARAGEYQGIGPFGTYDMAGNVKEWCANAVGDRRYILGGGWNEPNYQYRTDDARLPFDRSANNGFRLVTLPDPAAVPAAANGPVDRLTRDYDAEKPVGDDVFAALARLYSYDKSDLAPKVESTDDESDAWRIERISYNAAYGGERIAAYPRWPTSASSSRLGARCCSRCTRARTNGG